MATSKKTTAADKQKPAAPKAAKTADKKTDKAKKPANKESLTPEEKARKAKLKETLALLKADPEWPAFLEAQKQALLDLRDSMLPNMQDVTRDHLRSGASNVSSSSGQHIGDAGSEAEVRDLTLRLLGETGAPAILGCDAHNPDRVAKPEEVAFAMQAVRDYGITLARTLDIVNPLTRARRTIDLHTERLF